MTISQRLDQQNITTNFKSSYVVGSIIGNACEWYDYVIYGNLAPILSMVFFPENDKIVSLMLTFAIFAVGFLVRPLGGMIFGHIGDKHGRKKAFLFSILLIAIPSLAIGLLPSYDSIGRLSPILLVVFRLLQGIAIGGEYPTMIAYISELSPAKSRGYIGSFASLATVAGVLLATITVAMITKGLSHKDLVSYGWRIPFLISSVTVAFGYYIRQKLPESMIFLSEKKRDKYPFVEAIKNNKKEMVKIFFYLICIAISYYTFNIFSTTYFTTVLNVGYLMSLYISIASILVLMLLLPIFGYFSDIYGRKKITLIAIFSMIIFIYPIYFCFSQKIIWLAIISQFLFAALISAYLAPLPALIAEQVETRVRCSSTAVGYNLALAIFGGTAPMVDMYIIKYFSSSLAPSIYLIISGIISFTAALFMRDLTGRDLD